MKFEVFEELIITLKKCEDQSFAANQLGIDLIEYDTPFSHATWLAIRAHYGKAASEWIEWFLYERESLNGSINGAWDENGNEICHTIESLWQVIEELRQSDKFEEYSLPVIEHFDPEKFTESLNNLFGTYKNRNDESSDQD
jgi:hypothetical protein